LSLSLESLFDTRNYITVIVIVIIINIIIIIIVLILGVRLMIGGFFPPDCCYRSFVLSLGVTMNTYCVVNLQYIMGMRWRWGTILCRTVVPLRHVTVLDDKITIRMITSDVTWIDWLGSQSTRLSGFGRWRCRVKCK